MTQNFWKIEPLIDHDRNYDLFMAQGVKLPKPASRPQSHKSRAATALLGQLIRRLRFERKLTTADMAGCAGGNLRFTAVNGMYAHPASRLRSPAK